MSTEETQADTLARWLDAAPGTPLPEDIDPEVLEAVLALRPDLAPAPRVEVDDLLAGLTAGPLAEDTGEVVPFPPGSSEEVELVTPRPANNRRWWAAAGTVSALAAAALFTLTLTQRSAEPALVQSASMPRTEAVEAAPAKDADSTLQSAPKSAAREAPAEPVASAPPPAPSRPAPIIPEAVEAEAELDAVADLDDELGSVAGGGSGGMLGGIEEEPAQAPMARSRASSGAASTVGPAGGAPRKAEARQDAAGDFTGAMAEARALARSGQAAAGAERLEPWIAPPAAQGQEAALMAADLWLQAGEARRAADVASLGLALDGRSSTLRSELLQARARAFEAMGDDAAAARDRAAAGD